MMETDYTPLNPVFRAKLQELGRAFREAEFQVERAASPDDKAVAMAFRMQVETKLADMTLKAKTWDMMYEKGENPEGPTGKTGGAG